MIQIKKESVLITGASRGIGRACALLFAKKGYHVFLNCARSIQALKQVREEILAMENSSCELCIGDVGNPDDVAHIFQIISSSPYTNGGVDVLINNAGIAHIGLLSDMSDEQWMQLINTNLSSVFYCCRAAIPNMVTHKKGRIINISSMWGRCGASCEAAYSASKAGVHGLTQALAKELAPSNIQVNAIAFGVIDTEMNAQLDAEERTQLEYEIPAGRFASPHEAAEIIFQTAIAPSYMTGQIIGFDGGFV